MIGVGVGGGGGGGGLLNHIIAECQHIKLPLNIPKQTNGGAVIPLQTTNEQKG